MKIFTKSKIIRRSMIITLICVSAFLQAFSQEGNQKKAIHGKQASEIIPGAVFVLQPAGDDYPSSVKLTENSGVTKDAFVTWLKHSVKISSDVDFILVKTETDELGYMHQRYIQTYEGIPVDRGGYVVQLKNGQVTSFNGDAFAVRNIPIKPGISEYEALEKAKAFIGADKYMWEEPIWEQEIKTRLKDNNASYFPKGELTVTKYGTNQSAGALDAFRLAYWFDIYSLTPSTEQRVFVDAQSGDILYALPLSSDCEPAVNFSSIFNGNRSVQTDKFTGSDFRLKDNCLAAEVYVRNWGSATSTPSPVEIQNTTNTWTTQNERFGASVLWETKQAYNYFSTVHGRSSYDNANGDVNAYINAVFYSAGCACDYVDNASMSFTGGTMKVGLGSSGTLANSWSSVDIIGHEYTHAVTGSSSMLTYQGESGALNESFSDIFGEMIENYVAGPNDWLMGDDRTDGAIRSMSDPNDFNNPDTYLGTYWANTCGGCGDAGGVHTNSGVQNYWFYLVAMGGSGTNDNGDNYSVSGLGRTAASAIAFRNQTVKLSSGSDYAAARAGAIEAAEDLYGACSNEVKQVTNAWYAVGVGEAYCEALLASPLKPGGYNISCNGGSNGAINLTLLGTGPFTILWDDGPVVQNRTGLSAGTYGVTITDATGCSDRTTITLTEPTPLSASAVVTSNYNGYAVSCNGASDGVATASGSGGAPPYAYQWDANAGNQATAIASGLSAGTYFVTVTDANGCSAITSTTLTEPTPLSASAVVTSNYNGYAISCFGGTNGVSTAAGSGGVSPYSYLWDANAGSQTTAIASGLAAGTYNVTVTDANGCSASATVTLNEPPQLLISAGPNQTVYYGYPPAACATLSYSGAAGGVPPYSFQWSTGETTQNIVVCPQVSTEYIITITDLNNCTATDTVIVCAIDVRCGKNLDKVEICHTPPGNPANPQTLCVALSAVATHLAHGDLLAACGTDRSCNDLTPKSAPVADNLIDAVGFDLKASPNPFQQSTLVTFTTDMDGQASLRLVDFTGRLVNVLFDQGVQSNTHYEVNVEGSSLRSGIYYCMLIQGDGKVKVVKLIKKE
jgi:Zn-dependent metalloprotease